jgi:hypothetical protein
MEAPLSLAPEDDPALLEEIPIDVSTGDAAVWRECNSDKFSESTGVVVALRLCVAECLQYWIRLEYLTLQKTEPTSGR